MRPYVVRQGDYLTKLAHTMGFDAQTVWSHSVNTAIREKRKQPDMLQPGDILYVPEEPKPRLPIKAGTTNSYAARIPKMPVELRLVLGGEAIANEPYRILGVGPDPIEGKTDEHGQLSTEVRVHVREIEVELLERKRTLRVRVGNMDPMNEVSGVRKRLTHLGFYQPTRVGVENEEGTDADALVAAIKAFQGARKLPATGVVDDDTRDALIAAHGS